MIVVLHGDNQVTSRNRFNQLESDFTKKGWQILTFDGKNTDFNQLNLAASSGSLLGEGIVVFVEGFFTRSKKVKIESSKLTGNIVFWETKLLPKTIISGFPKNWVVENFAIPKLIFKFLDTLSPNHPQASLNILHSINESDESDFIIPLVAWHVRNLILAKLSPESLNVPSWKFNKLFEQANKFSEEQLFSFHRKLLELDRNSKTGANDLPLSSSLDLLIANI